MKFLLNLTLLASLLLFSPSAAEAKFIFGDERKIIKIADVDLKSPSGEPMYLGHVITTKFFLLGVYLRDDGYVLGVRGKNDGYYPLPDRPMVVAAQKTGILPDPLPPYTISPIRYLIGYSLWIALLVIFGWPVLKKQFARKPS